MTFTLAPTPPFRLDLTSWTLRRRANNGAVTSISKTSLRVTTTPLLTRSSRCAASAAEAPSTYC